MKRYQRGAIELVALVMIISLACNALLYRAMTAQKARAITAETNLDTANKATKACNDSIDGLAAAAFQRGEAAGKKREKARVAARELEKQAQTELSTPAAVPGDDCKSAQLRVTRILRDRGKP